MMIPTSPSDADLPLVRLAEDLAAYDTFIDHGIMFVLRDDVRYALSLIESLRACCDERGAIIERMAVAEVKAGMTGGS